MTAPLLALTDLSGDLTLDDQTEPVTCNLTVEQDGTAIVRCTPIPLTPANIWLLERSEAHDGGFLPWWHLRARSNEGDVITSDYLTIRSSDLSKGDQGTVINLELTASRMTLTHREQRTASGCAVTYHTIGMHGNAVQQAAAPEGMITLHGAPRPENEEHVTGFLKIAAHDDEARSLNDWLAACDERTRHTLRIISLADGKNLVWSIRQTKHHDQLISTELYGPQHASPGPDHIFHHLNLQPVLELAVTNYTPELRATTGIETAIDLFLITSPHVEVQLLIAMTAIEHLTSIYTTHHDVPTPLPKDTFAAVKKELQRAYNDAITPFAHDEAKVKRVRDNIGTLNETTFHDNLAGLFQEYKVSIDDIKDAIAKARKARNDIAHRGTTTADFKTFYTHVLVLRELLKRIVLTLLKYEGHYQSFLHGPAWTPFPPQAPNP
jgi:hypothetical protein